MFCDSVCLGNSCVPCWLPRLCFLSSSASLPVPWCSAQEPTQLVKQHSNRVNKPNSSVISQATQGEGIRNAACVPWQRWAPPCFAPAHEEWDLYGSSAALPFSLPMGRGFIRVLGLPEHPHSHSCAALLVGGFSPARLRRPGARDQGESAKSTNTLTSSLSLPIMFLTCAVSGAFGFSNGWFSFSSYL